MTSLFSAGSRLWRRVSASSNRDSGGRAKAAEVILFVDIFYSPDFDILPFLYGYGTITNSLAFRTARHNDGRPCSPKRLRAPACSSLLGSRLNASWNTRRT